MLKKYDITSRKNLEEKKSKQLRLGFYSNTKEKAGKKEKQNGYIIKTKKQKLNNLNLYNLQLKFEKKIYHQDKKYHAIIRATLQKISDHTARLL